MASARWIRAMAARCSCTKPASERLIVAQGLIEEGAVELAVGSLEGRVVHDRARRRAGPRRERPSSLACSARTASVTRLVRHLLVDAEGAGLLGGDDRAELAAEPLEFVGIGSAELIDRDRRVADLGHRGGGRCAEDVADAPDGEADDQSAEKDGGDELCRPRLCPALRMSRSIVNPFPENSLNRADNRSGARRKGQVWLKDGSSLC